MEIRFSGEKILTLSKTQEKVIQNEISSEIFVEDMSRRLEYMVLHPFNQCVDRNRSKWMSDLKAQGHSHVPADTNQFVEMGFSSEELTLDPSEDKESIVHMDQIEKFRVIPLQKKAIKKMIGQDCCHPHIKERMAWILQHKFERCMERLRNEWIPKLEAAGISQIPLDDEAFANLVFGRDEYKDRTQRDKDALR